MRSCPAARDRAAATSLHSPPMPVPVPTDLGGALAALGADPTAHVLAGGTDVMVEVNFGHRRPPAVVVVDRLPELAGVRHDPVAGRLRIGAGVTYRRLMEPPVA